MVVNLGMPRKHWPSSKAPPLQFQDAIHSTALDKTGGWAHGWFGMQHRAPLQIPDA
jgi:hypothetical protein